MFVGTVGSGVVGRMRVSARVVEAVRASMVVVRRVFVCWLPARSVSTRFLSGAWPAMARAAVGMFCFEAMDATSQRARM